MSTTTTKKAGDFFSNASFITASILVFLVPIAFFPGGAIDTYSFKTLLVGIGSILTVIFFLLHLLKTKTRMRLPVYILPLLLLPLILSVSAFFGVDAHKSFLGVNWNVYTVNFVSFLCIFAAALIAGVAKNKEDVLKLLTLFFFSSVILILFDALRFMVSVKFLSPGFLGISSSSLAGSYNDLAFVSGMVALIAFIAADFLNMRQIPKILLGILSVFCVLMIAFVNLSLPFYFFNLSQEAVIVFFGLVSIAVFYYFKKKSVPAEQAEEKEKKPRHPYVSILTAAAALALVFFGSGFSSLVGKTFNLSFYETNLSWQGTIDVAKGTLEKEPLLGSGPATFDADWSLYKPAAVNSTSDWNTDFYSATGFLPTQFITTGIVGTLAWLFFVVLLLVASCRVLWLRSREQKTFFLNFSSVMVALYLLGASFFYGIGATLVFGLFLLFSCTSILSLDKEKRAIKKIAVAEERHESMPEKMREAFILISLVLLFGWAGLLVKKSIAFYDANKALFESNSQAAIADLVKAATIDPNGLYLRLLSAAYLSDIGQAISSSSAANTKLTDQQSAALVAEAKAALNSTGYSLNYDKDNFRTYISSGNTYETVAFYGAPDFYDNAIASYTKAAGLSPASPLPYVLMARVEARRNNYDASQADIAKALQIKPDYSDAYVLASELASAKGDAANADKYLAQAVYLAPDNSNLSYEMGTVKYSEGDYQNAAAYFYNALKTDPTLLTARFALALSLYQLGDAKDAIDQMTIVDSSGANPSQTGPLLQKMKAGQQLFVVPAAASSATSTEAVKKTSTSTAPKAKKGK